MKIETYYSPKIGNSETEYEDAFAINPGKGKIAVADGASDSIFSGLWARSLVNSYVNSDLSITSDDFIENLVSSARVRWHTDIEWDSLRLFVKNKALGGSYSTLILVESMEGNSFSKVRVLSVGDSCILLERNGSLLSFPLSDYEQFNISPKLVWSGYGSPFSTEYKWNKPVFSTEDLEPGQDSTVIVATDAVSKWLLQYYPDSWNGVMEHTNDLREYLTEQVKGRKMRNDDLTLVKVII